MRCPVPLCSCRNGGEPRSPWTNHSQVERVSGYIWSRVRVRVCISRVRAATHVCSSAVDTPHIGLGYAPCSPREGQVPGMRPRPTLAQPPLNPSLKLSGGVYLPIGLIIAGILLHLQRGLPMPCPAPICSYSTVESWAPWMNHIHDGRGLPLTVARG